MSIGRLPFCRSKNLFEPYLDEFSLDKSSHVLQAWPQKFFFKLDDGVTDYVFHVVDTHDYSFGPRGDQVPQLGLLSTSSDKRWVFRFQLRKVESPDYSFQP